MLSVELTLIKNIVVKMTRILLNSFLLCLLMYTVFAVEQKVNIGESEKSVAKRGILNVHRNHHHFLSSPHLHHAVSPQVHNIVTKYPITPYHIHHGGASVTSFNVNYPLVSKAAIPAYIPPYHHHHHHFVPKFHSILPHHHQGVLPYIHVTKPIVPVAIPIPKYPLIFPQKPIIVHSKPHFAVSPSFVPISTPSDTPPAPAIPLSFSSGRKDQIKNQKCSFQQQVQEIPINFPPHNYHAHRLVNHAGQHKTNNKKFQFSGHSHHLAQYMQSQQLIQEPQST